MHILKMLVIRWWNGKIKCSWEKYVSNFVFVSGKLYWKLKVFCEGSIVVTGCSVGISKHKEYEMITMSTQGCGGWNKLIGWRSSKASVQWESGDPHRRGTKKSRCMEEIYTTTIDQSFEETARQSHYFLSDFRPLRFEIVHTYNSYTIL